MRDADWTLAIRLYTLFNLVTLCTLGRRRLRGGLVLFLANEGKLSAFDDGAIDRHFGDVFAARDVVHDIEHDPLEHRAQRARAGSFCDRLRCESTERVFCYGEPYAFHREKLGILLYHRIPCFT